MYFDLDENMNVRLSLDEKRVCSFCGGEKLWLIKSYKKNNNL